MIYTKTNEKKIILKTSPNSNNVWIIN